MPVFVLILPFLASAAQQDARPIMVTARPWAPYLSPMGEPFRSRSNDDDPFARWFREADLDRDGTLSPGEFQADAARFFRTLDSNRDGVIDAEELATYESRVAPEVQVNSNWKRTRQEAALERQGGAKPGRQSDRAIDGYQLNGLQGAARYSLLNIPEPVAGADSDLNGKISLEEFTAAAAYRFQLLDSPRRGALQPGELEAMLPSRPHSGSKPKPPRRDEKDQRIAIPLPPSGS